MSRFLQRHAQLSGFLVAGFVTLSASAEGTNYCGWEDLAPLTTGGMVRAITLDETIYVLGGGTFNAPSKEVRAYDPAADDWQDRAPMTDAFSNFGLTELSGKLYRIGGNLSSGTVVASAETYDPQTDEWSSIADLPVMLGHLAAATLDGKIYAIGGWSNGGVADAVHAYDPATDEWTPVAPMNQSRAGHTAVTHNGKIYAIGGIINNSQVFANVEVYDATADSWSYLKPLPEARGLHASALAGGKLYVVGGLDGSLRPTDSVFRYDPAIDDWLTLASLPTANASLGAAAFLDKVYAFGGLAGPLAGPEIADVRAISALGKDGLLTRSVEEPAGQNCPAGGTRVEVGQDTSCNGELDDADEPTVIYVCRGQDGTEAAEVLIESHEEAAGDNCPRGGTRVDAGHDLNGDGKLSSDEITATNFVCDGQYGAKGEEGGIGLDGRDGQTGAEGPGGCSTAPSGARSGAGFATGALALLMLGWARRRAKLTC